MNKGETRKKALNVRTNEMLAAGQQNGMDWVKENTAILVVHGIGNQLPLETMDQFARGLITEYAGSGDINDFLVEHVVVERKNDGDPWFDNVLRIRKKLISSTDSTNELYDDNHIDLYEYYWADHTEDKADFNDINDWLQGVVRGANKYYKRNAALGIECGDQSALFRNEEFNYLRYKAFISIMGNIIVWLTLLLDSLKKLLLLVPVGGVLLERQAHRYTGGKLRDVANILGDIVIYNVVDPKSKYYDMRKHILEGAVKAIQFLVERKDKTNDEGDFELAYPSIIIAGHSLGSQVAYDALNRINFLVNESKIDNYDCNGICEKPLGRKGRQIVQQLRGFVTFGSPLDKIAFFLRENIPSDQFVRRQLLNNFHGFKQKDWNVGEEQNGFKVKNNLCRRLDDMRWRNYYDMKDYVSGALDYYEGLTNINCDFGKKGWFAFTHSDYWTHAPFYRDIISNFLTEKNLAEAEKYRENTVSANEI